MDARPRSPRKLSPHDTYDAHASYDTYAPDEADEADAPDEENDSNGWLVPAGVYEMDNTINLLRISSCIRLNSRCQNCLRTYFAGTGRVFDLASDNVE